MTILTVPTTTFGMDWTGPLHNLTPHARFIRSVNWAATALGAPETWPPQLHQMLDLIMADPTPSAVMWGDSLTMIYNEGFVEFAGSKHPTLMGGTPMVSYAEVWEPQFAPIIKLGKETGQATRHKNVPLSLMRRGYMEECFVDYTFVPIPGPDKNVIGFYHTAVDTTIQNLSRRRTQTLIDIGDNAGAARNMKDYWEAVLRGFESNIWDIPYAIAYEFQNYSDKDSISSDHHDLDSQSLGSGSNKSGSISCSNSSAGIRIPRSCSLAGVIGKHIGEVPLSLDVRDEGDPFHQVVKKATKSGQLTEVNLNGEELPGWLVSKRPGRAFEEPCKSAVIMPIRPTTRNDAEGKNAIGFVIVGLNPRREFDQDYERYARLWCRQLATSAASVVLLEQEMARQKQLTAQLSLSTKKAQESETRFSRFAELSNVGMWIVDPNGFVQYSNRAWNEMLPNSDDTDGLSSLLVSSVHEDSHPALDKAWKTLTQDKSPTSLEIRLKATLTADDAEGHKSMKSRYIICSAYPEIAEDGSLKAVWGCNTDIT